MSEIEIQRLNSLIERLREIKEEVGVSAERLAFTIGVSSATLGRLIRGKNLFHPNPSTIKLIKVFFSNYEQAKKRGTLNQLFKFD